MKLSVEQGESDEERDGDDVYRQLKKVKKDAKNLIQLNKEVYILSFATNTHIIHYRKHTPPNSSMIFKKSKERKE